MTRDEAWVRFAAAVYADIEITACEAADLADAMLAEYDKRWDRIQKVDLKPIPQPMEGA